MRRLVEDDDRRQARRLGGNEPRERGHVGSVLVAAAALPGLLRRPRLARDRIALDLRRGARADARDLGEHGCDLLRRARRDDPVARRGLRLVRDAARVDGALHQLGSDVDPAVGDGVVRPQHLQRGHRESLADGHRADRRPRPGVGSDQQARGLAGEVQRRARPETEGAEVAIQTLLTQVLSDHDRADVRRVGHDVGDRPVLRIVSVVVHEPAPAHVHVVRHDELVSGPHDAFLERGRDRDDLVHRARFVDARHAEVVRGRPRGRSVGAGHQAGHRQHLTVARVHHDGGPALRRALLDLGGERLLGLVLEGAVEGEHEVVAAPRGPVLAHTGGDLPPARVTLDEEIARAALEPMLELQLEPGEAVVVDADLAEQGRGEVARRLEALRLV